MRTLNSILAERALKEKILESVFETYWPHFEDKFNEILKKVPSEITPIKRRNDDILLELLSVTRGLERRIRSFENDRNERSYLANPSEVEILPYPKIESIVTDYYNKGMQVSTICNKMLKTYGVGPEVTKHIVFKLVKDMTKDIMGKKCNEEIS